MSSHKLPKLLKIGEYTLDKENFTLTHKNQRKDSSGRKRHIEYACDNCNSIYVLMLRDELKKEFPWLCRSCRTKRFWEKETYRNALLAGMTDDVKVIHRQNLRKNFKLMLNNPIKYDAFCQKLRQRPAEIYSKARKNMRKSVTLKHWKTNEELICVGSYEIAFVNWCNANCYDFDWQISHIMPNNRKYIIDAFVKDGPLKNKWVEIKGYLYGIGKEKWEWFYQNNPNDAVILMHQDLKLMKIL